jgi:hypothetical protein
LHDQQIINSKLYCTFFPGSVTQRETCDCKRIQRKVDVIQEMLVKLSTALKVDISELNLQSSSDDDTLVGQIVEVEQSIQNNSARSEKSIKGWDYENSDEIAALQMRDGILERQFWLANNAALNDGYQFEKDQTAIGQKAKDSLLRESPNVRGSVDHGQSDGRKRERVDSGRSERRKLGDSIRDDEFLSTVRSNSPLTPYRQARDETDIYSTRAKRRQFRTEVYQKRLKDTQPTNEKRRGSHLSREIPSDGINVKRDRSPHQSYSDKIKPREQVRRSESMPTTTRDNLPQRRPKKSYYHSSGRNSPRSLNNQPFSRQTGERRRNSRENTREEERSPERFVY